MTEPETPQESAPAEAAEPAAATTEDETQLRAQLEEEIRQVRVEDLLLQSVASLLNLSARRIVKEDERDLAQAQLGIEASRAVVDLLPEQAQGQVREALSELQLLYAKHAQGDADAPAEPSPADDASAAAGDSGLWTPG